jgi:protease I
MKVVFVIAQKDFRDEELLEPKNLLAGKGVECFIASKNKGTHRGMLGAIVESTLSLKEVDNSFDAIIFIGGSGATQYFNDPEAQGLAVKYMDLGKLVAAICIAPSILANAGVLNGKKATCFSSESQNLKSKGAIYTKKPIEVEGNIITASGPIVARKFGEYIAHSLGKN